MRDQFGGALERAIVLSGMSKQLFASSVGSAGIHPSQLSRYLSGVDVPERTRLFELVGAVPDRALGEMVRVAYLRQHLSPGAGDALPPDAAVAEAASFEEVGLPEHGLGVIDAANAVSPREFHATLATEGTRIQIRLLRTGDASKRVGAFRNEALLQKQPFDILCAKQLDGRVLMESGMPLPDLLVRMGEAETFGLSRLREDRRMRNRVFAVRRDRANAFVDAYLNGERDRRHLERARDQSHATAVKTRDPHDRTLALHARARAELALGEVVRGEDTIDEARALKVGRIEIKLQDAYLRSEIHAVRRDIAMAVTGFEILALDAAAVGDLRFLALAQSRIALLRCQIQSRS